MYMEDRKQLLIDRSKERKTLQEIGNEIGLSKERVRQLYVEYGIKRKKGCKPSNINKDISREDIYYLAGLFEGEGSFRLASGRYPNVRIGMTDGDIIDKVKSILGVDNNIMIEYKENFKTVYRLDMRGQSAIEFMKMIYPLMGIRRKSKIEQILEFADEK